MELKSLATLAAELAAGTVTSTALTEQALAAIAAPDGEGSRAFVSVHRSEALATAAAIDRMRGAGIAPSPLAGLPISIKDLFDEAGHVTRAASRTREDAAPAKRDSWVAAKLRAAGAVLIGRTNMTEFAYSGLGLNPHFGTPRNPWDRATGRIPGGSSSGAAVSVTDGMAVAAIGTDTGGSVRVPAALCGLTGFKATHGRISLDGCFPLSRSLDSVGPIAPTVACCALLDRVMRGLDCALPSALPLAGLRFSVPTRLVLDDAEPLVARRYDAVLQALSVAGAVLTEIPFAELEEVLRASPHGGILGAEAWAIHRQTLTERGDLVDPRVRQRIERASALSAADYIDLQRQRASLIARANMVTAPFDAVLMPTVVCVAPKIDDLLATDDHYVRTNALVLRNTSLGNYLERCALSIPMHLPDSAPMGLMLMGETGGDDRLLRIGRAVEPVVRRL